MQKGIIRAVLFLTFLFAGILGSLVLVDAAGPGNGIPDVPDVPGTGEGLLQLFKDISQWFFAFIMVAATIFIILAALQFITGGGDASQVAGARQKLMYGIIGIAVAVLSLAIPAVVRNIIGTS